MNLGNATGHPSFVMSNSFSNQVIAQVELFTKHEEYNNDVYRLPKVLDEKVAKIHVLALGGELTKLIEGPGRVHRRGRRGAVQAGALPLLTPEAGRVIPRGDGDGWARCARGHRHWGVFGAAGLLLWHDGAVLLQHRARVEPPRRHLGHPRRRAQQRRDRGRGRRAGGGGGGRAAAPEPTASAASTSTTTAAGPTPRWSGAPTARWRSPRSPPETLGGALGARRRGRRAAAAPRVRRDVGRCVPARLVAERRSRHGLRRSRTPER